MGRARAMAAQDDLFLRNPRFVGLKFPDMSRPETLQKKYVGHLSRQALNFMKSVLQVSTLAGACFYLACRCCCILFLEMPGRCQESSLGSMTGPSLRLVAGEPDGAS